MMMERIAARPIDQPDLGVSEPLPVVVRLARMQQHVRQARHRDEIGKAVAALGNVGTGTAGAGFPVFEVDPSA
jgi:hypothetical protein